MKKIEIKSFKILNEVAFRHTTYLYKSAINTDKNGLASIPYLERILNAEIPDVYETLMETFADVKIGHNVTTDSCVTPLISDSYVIWGRMYVIAYFALYEDEFWQKVMLPKILELQPNKTIKAEMESAADYIKKYYVEKQEWVKKFITVSAPAAEDFIGLAEQIHMQTRLEELENITKEKKELLTASFRVAENHKTDVLKVLSYMYDMGLFVDQDGQELSRKKKHFMLAMGQFFNADFGKYAQIIGKAAQEPKFTDVFEKMLDMANNQYTYGE